MGFSSLEAKAIVDGCVEKSLLGHGAARGLPYSKHTGMEIREAGLALMQPANMEQAARLFGGEQ
jgi:D-ornithine 4,5-aminomutase subunit alpha